MDGAGFGGAWGLLASGFLVGLTVAAPIGPINVLCIQRTLAFGPATGIATALGCAAADATYGAIAAFGIGVAAAFLSGQLVVLKFVGAAILMWLGISALRAGPAQAGAAERLALPRAALTTYALTLSNPLTLLIFASLLSGAAIPAEAGGGVPGLHGAALMTAGVFLGTFSWMSGLVTAGTVLRRKIGARLLAAANRVGATLLIGYALWFVWSGIRAL